MRLLDRFKPARTQAHKDVTVVANLDDILTKPVAFVLHGQTHVIETVDLENWARWTEALTGLLELKEKKVDVEELLQAYLKIFNSLCPSITLEDLKRCSQSQVAAIYGVFLDHVGGRLETEDKKKVVTSLSQIPENNGKQLHG